MAGLRFDQPNAVEALARQLLKVAPRPGTLSAFATAFALIIVSALLKIPIDMVTGAPLPPYITIYPFLPLIGFLAGFRVGAASVIFALLLAWYVFVPPLMTFAVPERRTLATMVVFAFAGTFTVLAGSFARQMLQRFLANEEAEQRNAREAVHRTKNLITVIRSLGRMEKRQASDLNTFWEALDGKLSAIARAQDLLVGVREGDTGLADLVASTIEPCIENPRLHYRAGPAAPAPSTEFSGLALALHELCTNSLKYGAMGTDEGGIELTWTLASGVCTLSWLETCGSIRDGEDSFGSLLIRTALNRVPASKVEYQRATGSVTCLFIWPVG